MINNGSSSFEELSSTMGDRVASLLSEAAGILSFLQNVEVRYNGHVHCLAHEFY